jgi:hypothetical protein
MRLAWVSVMLPLMLNLAHANDLALGDSIALGTGHALGLPTVARKGAGSCRIARWGALRGSYGHVILSAGINDGGGCVASLRGRLQAKEVIWVLPAPINSGRVAVLRAMHPGDRAVTYACRGGCTRTNFHPGSYRDVAAAVRRVW